MKNPWQILRTRPHTVQPVLSESPPLAKRPVSVSPPLFNGNGNGRVSQEEWKERIAQVEARIVSLAEGGKKRNAKKELGSIQEEWSLFGRQRHTKLAHLLDLLAIRELEALRNLKRSRAASNGNNASREKKPPLQPTLPPPPLERVNRALLPIDGYVPSSRGLDPESVRKVISAFLMFKPPALGGSYAPFEYLRDDFEGVSPREVRKIFTWLKSMDVLDDRPHKIFGKKLLSLKLHAEGKDSPGREIAQIIRKAAREMNRMG